MMRKEREDYLKTRGEGGREGKKEGKRELERYWGYIGSIIIGVLLLELLTVVDFKDVPAVGGFEGRGYFANGSGESDVFETFVHCPFTKPTQTSPRPRFIF